jgi:sulfite reductase (NADPH) hemoprotein beta-component
MYRYDELDRTLVAERVGEFREQVSRRLSGELNEESFKPLRLMNGLYLQLHAYMLRVAIPYGVLSARQLKRLAAIARRYDKGYGHFTTRQNLQLNWPKLDETPEILESLAEVEMHAIQTSGNCIRNVTTDHLAGVAADEIEDPRVYCAIIRQWSTLHPEFSFLPRKFKIAVTGSPNDRAAVAIHDIGLRLHRDENGEVGFEVLVGGGLGRTPMLAKTIRRFLPKHELLGYLEAILRVYNLFGRRDNLYKARIKILVHDLGAERFAALVEEEWEATRHLAPSLPAAEIDRIRAHFAPPPYEALETPVRDYEVKRFEEPDFARWTRTNVTPHRVPGYGAVTLSLKPPGGTPGDMTAVQMDAVALLAERYSQGEIRVTHSQNLVLPHVKLSETHALWLALAALGLASANIGLVSDIISCPGLDYCNLANARSIPIAQDISRYFAEIARQHEIGPLAIKISGCINACGHHHVGDIGILGLDKRGEEHYQITLGGDPGREAALGQLVGPAFSAETVVAAVVTIVTTYLALREEGETFARTFARIGLAPFKEALYAAD